MLDRVLHRTIRELDNHTIGSQEYAKTLDAVIKLHALTESKKSRVSRDTMLIVAANLLGIFMIIKHENVNVITSRAMNLITMPRP